MKQPIDAPPVTEEERARDWRAFLEAKGGPVRPSSTAPSTFPDHSRLETPAYQLNIQIVCSQRELQWALAAPSEACKGDDPGWSAAKRGRAMTAASANLVSLGVGEPFLPTAIRVSRVGRIYLTTDDAPGFAVNRCYGQGTGRVGSW
jgi:hypothetical protein